MVKHPIAHFRVEGSVSKDIPRLLISSVAGLAENVGVMQSTKIHKITNDSISYAHLA